MTGFSALQFEFRENTPTTPFRQAGVTGVAFTIEPRTLLLTVQRLVGSTYQPVAGVTFHVTLSTGLVVLTTNASGQASLDFPDPTIVIEHASAVPTGFFLSQTRWEWPTRYRNQLTLTYLPTSLVAHEALYQLI